MKVLHMKIVNDQKRKKKSGRHTLVVEEKLRMKKKVLGGKMMVSDNLQN